MKFLPNNLSSVLLWAPARYRDHPCALVQACGVAAVTLTVGVGWASPHLLWIMPLSWAYYFAAVWVMTAGAKQPPAISQDAEASLARGLFAGAAALWPLVLGLWLQCPLELLAPCTLYALAQIGAQAGHQVDPVARGAARRTDAVMATCAPVLAFPNIGPPIGMFQGRPIPAWLRDDRGRFHDFIGCAIEPQRVALRANQTLLSPGMMYELRSA